MVEYRLTYCRRKTIGIYVSQEKGVEVRAPYFVSKQEIQGFISAKEEWIDRQLYKLSQLPKPFRPEYQWGESLYFLGRLNTVHYEHEQAPDIVIASGCASDDSGAVEKKINNWFRQQSLVHFQHRHDYWRQKMARFSLPPSEIGVRKMKSRWGSCRSNGKITLNINLLKYPLSCIDVVVVHELCHLLEFNHSPAFYRLLSEVQPDWKQLDHQLRALSLRY